MAKINGLYLDAVGSVTFTERKPFSVDGILGQFQMNSDKVLRQCALTGASVPLRISWANEFQSERQLKLIAFIVIHSSIHPFSCCLVGFRCGGRVCLPIGKHIQPP